MGRKILSFLALLGSILLALVSSALLTSAAGQIFFGTSSIFQRPCISVHPGDCFVPYVPARGLSYPYEFLTIIMVVSFVVFLVVYVYLSEKHKTIFVTAMLLIFGFVVAGYLVFRFIILNQPSYMERCKATCEATETARSPERDKTMIRNQCFAECAINQKVGTP